MDERWTTDAKLEALEAMREDAMTTKTRARAAVKALAGRLARGGETSEEARANRPASALTTALALLFVVIASSRIASNASSFPSVV